MDQAKEKENGYDENGGCQLTNFGQNILKQTNYFEFKTASTKTFKIQRCPSETCT